MTNNGTEYAIVKKSAYQLSLITVLKNMTNNGTEYTVNITVLKTLKLLKALFNCW
jgi:hypothetical protein